MQHSEPVDPGLSPLLRATGLGKSFPGVQALSGVDFDLFAGEVHCLIGENGAGKSTLVKILAGVQEADAGTFEVNGKAMSFANPQESQAAGVACIFQELAVVDGLSVSENILLGDEPGRFGFFDSKAADVLAQDLLDSIGFSELRASQQARDLSAAQRQAVMIAKALRQNARLIIMDEPTSPLEEAEVRKLFKVIDRLRAAGKGIIYVSHKMREIDELGDRITVFKDGHRVGTVTRGAATPEDLVRMMVGRKLDTLFPARDSQPGAPVLEVRGLSNAHIRNIDLTVRRNEILGIAGLVGSGRTELLRAIFGADRVSSGTVTVENAPVPPNSIPAAIEAGFAMVPEERRSAGIVPVLSVADNTAIIWDQYVNRRAHDGPRPDAIQKIIEMLGVRTASVTQSISALSGGNQQKVVVGKWLLSQTRVLLLDEPTRGVDVGAKKEIYQIIHDLAEQGLAVVFVSSELPELLGLADRIVVMNSGEIVGGLSGDATEEQVIELSMLHAATPILTGEHP
ncbi:sugar ABC transporter ATP-binding protein [Marinovum sp. PR37]|uniref:sugar ABC transporter ATP-binding protein n=1 Tax=Marinovum sp. PR37 TaxID=3028382 RepID=UPI0030841D3B